jgi:hypothetical protein
MAMPFLGGEREKDYCGFPREAFEYDQFLSLAEEALGLGVLGAARMAHESALRTTVPSRNILVVELADGGAVMSGVANSYKVVH